MKPPTQGDQIGTPPASPAGSTPPVSPLSGKLDCSYSVMSDLPICKLLICCTAVSKYSGAWSGGLETGRIRVWERG